MSRRRSRARAGAQRKRGRPEGERPQGERPEGERVGRADAEQ